MIFGSVPEGRTTMCVPSASSKRRTFEPESAIFVTAPLTESRTANHRSNQEVINQLKGSTNLVQSTLEENVKLESEVKSLETQVEELEQKLAETEDALAAAQEDAENYRALYESLTGGEAKDAPSTP